MQLVIVCDGRRVEACEYGLGMTRYADNGKIYVTVSDNGTHMWQFAGLHSLTGIGDQEEDTRPTEMMEIR